MIDNSRELFKPTEVMNSGDEKPATLTLKTTSGGQVWVLPWMQYGGCEIKDDVALVVFSYWLVKIQGERLLGLLTVFERRAQPILEEGKRMDELKGGGKGFHIQKITVQCLVK